MNDLHSKGHGSLKIILTIQVSVSEHVIFGPVLIHITVTSLKLAIDVVF